MLNMNNKCKESEFVISGDIRRLPLVLYLYIERDIHVRAELVLDVLIHPDETLGLNRKKMALMLTPSIK